MTGTDQTAQDPKERYRDALRLEALGLMTAGIVHDLGNMIQVLSSAINILERDPHVRETDALQPVVLGAIGSLDSASGMIRQILGFVRQSPAMEQAVDPALVLAAMERLFRWICPAGIVIDLHLDPRLPSLLCDRHRLENAVLNLVLNARDAMPDGGALTITARSLGLSPCQVEICVTDTGVGMDPALAKAAFEPLFTTKGGRGSGLGLAMVRQFAQELHGNASLSSVEGKGTSVTLRLPAGIAPMPGRGAAPCP